MKALLTALFAFCLVISACGASPGESTDPKFWKAEAIAYFPELADPESLFSKQTEKVYEGFEVHDFSNPARNYFLAACKVAERNMLREIAQNAAKSNGPKWLMAATPIIPPQPIAKSKFVEHTIIEEENDAAIEAAEQAEAKAEEARDAAETAAVEARLVREAVEDARREAEMDRRNQQRELEAMRLEMMRRETDAKFERWGDVRARREAESNARRRDQFRR